MQSRISTDESARAPPDLVFNNKEFMMSRLPCLVSAAICTALLAGTAHSAEVVRHSLLGGSKFPIARAVEVPAGTTILFHSGTTPAPADPKATRGHSRVLGRHQDSGTEHVREDQGIARPTRPGLRRRGRNDGLPGRRSRQARPHGFRRLHGRVLAILRHAPSSRICPHARRCRSPGWCSRACSWRSKFSWSDARNSAGSHLP